MRRRSFLQALFAFPLTAKATELSTGGKCPICGGKLVEAGSLKDDESKPSRNIELWNRSYHGAFWPFYNERLQICSRCYVVFNTTTNKWTRASEEPNSFLVPLQRSILSFPLPKKSLIKSFVVYAQSFGGKDAAEGRIESVSLWLATDRPTLNKIERYCNDNNLKFEPYTAPSMPNQTYIKAETLNYSFKPTPGNGADKLNRS